MDKTEESGPERERERVTTEGRHHHHRNQREFNTLLLGSLMGRIFWCSISKVSLVHQGHLLPLLYGLLFLVLLEQYGQSPAIIATFISHNPLGCFGISIMDFTPYGVG